MIYLNYMLSELRRRKGRTFLTALGLALGIALVITVSGLSAGLDRAQASVLEPLTGVGTDMSVTRPFAITSSTTSTSNGGPPQLSAAERAQIDKENGSQRVDFSNLTPGTTFTQTSFRGSKISFPASNVTSISKLSGVGAASGGLTLSMTTVSGTVPAASQVPQQRGGGGQGGGGPRSANFASVTVSGVDETNTALGALTPSQVTAGTYFTSATARQAIIDVGYANTNSLKVGSKLKIGGKTYTVVGLSQTPVGGASSDVYIDLTQLQKLSNRVGRVNTVYVRAASASQVDAVASEISSTLSGSSVSTAKTLAAQITGSLTDAKNLTSKLGFVLELVGLLAAIGIASLLTLSSVTKRIRELGTLKAIGWPKRLVVRQVAGESLLQGLLGGVLGVAIGLAASFGISAFAPTLKATVASATQGGFGFGGGPFGQNAAATAGSTAVKLTPQVSIALVAVAVGLAVLGGLVSGAVGGLRASRLRPAEALRHID
ncbi:MAG: putative transport system permease protein [Gaiellaceae bacterium]|nr:putative transport system permease protein [Gaiellaceae bacterium]